jgi:glycosyltransferase involved in cell wall biosynthesis
VRVLYVNHTGVVSGAERSLLILLQSLRDRVEPLLATPPGALADRAAQLGVPTVLITGTAGSLRPHPVHTPRALLEMGHAAGQVRRAARRHGAELVHANSIRAGLILALGRPPAATVVHVRDCLPPGAWSRATMRLIAATASTVLANSQYTASCVSALAPRARPQVVYNPVDLARFDPALIDRAVARARLAGELGEGGARRRLLGLVAQISPWKGQDTAIEALRLLVEQGVDAQLLLIGSAKFVSRSTRYDNNEYLARLRASVAAAGLEDRVLWLGEREDVPELISALDLLMLPSREEPFGRALIEGMALGVPVLATNVGGPREILEDGREGYLISPEDPAAWAAAARTILEQPELARRMGEAGGERARAFADSGHAEALLAVYRQTLARPA